MRISRLAQAIITASLTSTAFAGGFALSEQSVSAMGTANAGRASNAQDASVVYNNPAAMMQLKQAQFTGAMAFIDASTRISNPSGGFGPTATNDGDMVPFTYVPSGYFTSGDKGGWAWGVGAYGSYGLKTNYEQSFQGARGGDKSKITVLTVQPVMSYRINNVVSVAAGPTFNRLDALLTQSLAPNGAVGAEVKGKDWGYGYTLASYFDLTPATKAGVVYRSKVTYKIDDGSFTATSSGTPFVGPTKASTSATLPESVETGISHRLNQRTSLHASATWTRWSRLKTLDVSVPGGGPFFSSSSTAFHWKDTMAYSLGLTHQCSDKLQLRGGIAYDNSPVNPAFRSVRVPSADRYVASLGAGYALSKTLSVDVSYSYLQEKKATVAADPLAGNYSADFHNHANILGVQITQKL